MGRNRVSILFGALAVALAVAAAPACGLAAVNNTTTRSNTQHNITASHGLPSHCRPGAGRRCAAAFDVVHGHGVGRRMHRPFQVIKNHDSAST